MNKKIKKNIGEQMKARNMLYKETGIEKKASAATVFRTNGGRAINMGKKVVAKTEPKAGFLNKKVSKAWIIPGGIGAVGLASAAN